MHLRSTLADMVLLLLILFLVMIVSASEVLADG